MLTISVAILCIIIERHGRPQVTGTIVHDGRIKAVIPILPAQGCITVKLWAIPLYFLAVFERKGIHEFLYWMAAARCIGRKINGANRSIPVLAASRLQVADGKDHLFVHLGQK
ncbi:hypothetical protein D3C73_1188600 [compost metagenome]